MSFAPWIIGIGQKLANLVRVEIWSSGWKSFFDQKVWPNHIFGSKNDFHPDDQISTRTRFASFWPIPMIHGAKDIYFLWKNHWATFGQHLGNICCLNVALIITIKIRFCDFFDVITSLRQHLGNKCCLNVDQMLMCDIFVQSRCVLHQISIFYFKNSWK